jgi:fructose-specific phosphotransferase system IIC component
MDGLSEVLGMDGAEGHGLFIILLFGGFLFAYVTKKITDYHPPPNVYYVLNIIIFYLLGPLAWGLVWFFESGNTNRLMYLTYTYWGFFGIFALVSLIGWAISKKIEGKE